MFLKIALFYKFLDYLKAVYPIFIGEFKIKGNTIEEMLIKSGVTEGFILSPMLFNLYSHISGSSRQHRRWNKKNRITINNLRHVMTLFFIR